MSQSIIDRSKDPVSDIKLEPSRPRMLKAIKANTQGMHAISEACRSFRVDPNLSSFIRYQSNLLVEPLLYSICAVIPVNRSKRARKA